MNIMLGNLSTDQIEDRMGIKFPEPFRTDFNSNNQSSADTSTLGKENWHCFDMPFTLVCGNRDYAQKIFDALSPQVEEIKIPLQISIQEKK